jgi:hypothetical protein
MSSSDLVYSTFNANYLLRILRINSISKTGVDMSVPSSSKAGMARRAVRHRRDAVLLTYLENPTLRQVVAVHFLYRQTAFLYRQTHFLHRQIDFLCRKRLPPYRQSSFLCRQTRFLCRQTAFLCRKRLSPYRQSSFLCRQTRFRHRNALRRYRRDRDAAPFFLHPSF